MKCVICHGEQVEVTSVNEGINIGNDIVYVQITIPVCKTCGERYYDRKTMQFLEQTEKQLAQNKGSLKEIGKIMVYDGVKTGA